MKARARLARIFVYPVKSLGGIELAECAVDRRGLRLDRRWMLVDEAGVFISQRQWPRLARVAVRVMNDAVVVETPGAPPLTVPLRAPETPPVEVRVWRSVCAAVSAGSEAEAWFSDLLGQPTRLVYMPEGTERPVNPDHSRPGDIVSFADGYPVLAVSEASLDDLNSRLPQPIPMERFRPNLVVTGVPAFGEDAWERVELPGATFRGAKPCGRCVVTTVDQTTGEFTGKEPLRTLAKYRRDEEGEVLFGENLLVERTGIVAVGDPLEIISTVPAAAAV